MRHPQRTVDRLMREHGDVFTLHIFGTPFVLHTAPDEIRELLARSPQELAAGRANAMVAPLVGSASLLVLDGDEHLAMRRAQLPAMHGERLRSYEQQMRQAAERAVARLPLEGPVELWPRMQSLTLDVIIGVVFGIAGEREQREVRRAVKALLAAGTDRRLLARIALASAVLRRPPSPDSWLLRRVRRARSELARLLDREISRRRQAPDEDRDDVLSMLLAATDEAGQPLADSVVRDQLITLLVAGHETTATALTWAAERIARHPELQDRLAAEALDGRHELLEATVRETLRARPVLPIFMRETLVPVTVGGREYPAGTRVGVAAIGLHRRPELYPQPDEFRPERFLGDGAPGTYEWMPFGGGVRRCLGASFALLEMRLVLAALLAERRLVPCEERGESTRRRAIVLAPARGGTVLAPRRRSASQPSHEPSRAAARRLS